MIVVVVFFVVVVVVMIVVVIFFVVVVAVMIVIVNVVVVIAIDPVKVRKSTAVRRRRTKTDGIRGASEPRPAGKPSPGPAWDALRRSASLILIRGENRDAVSLFNVLPVHCPPRLQAQRPQPQPPSSGPASSQAAIQTPTA